MIQTLTKNVHCTIFACNERKILFIKRLARDWYLAIFYLKLLSLFVYVAYLLQHLRCPRFGTVQLVTAITGS